VVADETTITEIAASPEVSHIKFRASLGHSELSNHFNLQVAYVEKDAKIYALALTSQTGRPYGLSRISHRNQESTTYIYDYTAGSGVTVYAVDTGIYTSHAQFGNRAFLAANLIQVQQ
jgi:subtilisin family serine protease